jgi:hypothetical protein
MSAGRRLPLPEGQVHAKASALTAAGGDAAGAEIVSALIAAERGHAIDALLTGMAGSDGATFDEKEFGLVEDDFAREVEGDHDEVY